MGRNPVALLGSRGDARACVCGSIGRHPSNALAGNARRVEWVRPDAKLQAPLGYADAVVYLLRNLHFVSHVPRAHNGVAGERQDQGIGT